MRREFPSWAVLPPNAAEKTTTVIHKDFTSYPPELALSLASHDACIWAMGKSVRGMSEKEYTLLTHEYPMAALRSLRDAGVGKNRDADKPFRFIYVSGEHADPTEKSMQMWARVKVYFDYLFEVRFFLKSFICVQGKTENDVLSFCGSEQGLRGHILRPAYFSPSRDYSADWQNQRSATENVLDRILGPVFTFLVPSLVSPLNELSGVALGVSKGQWPDIDLFRNKHMRELAKEL